MELLVYLLILCYCDFFSVFMAMALDHYGKKKDYNKVVRKKINVILFKSKYENQHFLPTKNKPVSKESFIFQCVNIAYVLIYIAVASIETFIYPSVLMMYINVIIAAIYGTLNFICSIGLTCILFSRR